MSHHSDNGPLPSNANEDDEASTMALLKHAGTESQPNEIIAVTAPAVSDKDIDPLLLNAKKDISNDGVSTLALPEPAETASQRGQTTTVTAPAVSEKENDPLPSDIDKDVSDDGISTLVLPEPAETVSPLPSEIDRDIPNDGISTLVLPEPAETVSPLPSEIDRDIPNDGTSTLVLPEPAETVSPLPSEIDRDVPNDGISALVLPEPAETVSPLPSEIDRDIPYDEISPLVLPDRAGTVFQPNEIITVTAPAVLEQEKDPLPSDANKDVSNDGVSPLVLPEPAGTISQPDKIARVTAPALLRKENDPLPSNIIKDVSNNGALALGLPKRTQAVSQPSEIITVTAPGVLKKENEDPRPSIPQLAATPPTSTEPASDQLASAQPAGNQPPSSQLATRSLVETKGERDLVGRKKWKDVTEDDEQVDRENMIDHGKHAAETPTMTLNEVHKSKRASTTGSDKPSRVSAGALNPPDELYQGRRQVDDLTLHYIPYHFGGTDSNGMGEMVEEKPQEHAPSTREKQQRDEVKISEPAVAAPAPVDNFPMAATPVHLIGDDLEQQRASFPYDGQWYPMSLILASTGWEADPPIGNLPLMTAGSSMQEELDEPGFSVSVYTENGEPGPPVGDLPSLPLRSSMQRRVSNATAELVERTAKFLKVNMASEFESDETYSSSLWAHIKKAVRRAIEDCRKGIKDRARKDKPENSKGKRPIREPFEVSDPESSMTYITNWSLESPTPDSPANSMEVIPDEPSGMAASERIGMPLWGGFWKNTDIWPDDLMSASRPVGHTLETWWIVRRQWLIDCMSFWSQREMDEATRVRSVWPGPVHGMSMDRWVNDLSNDAVRAKYLYVLR